MEMGKQAAPSPVKAASSRRTPPWVRARNTTWKTFTSVKLALVLILVLTALTFIGTLVSQKPSYIQVGSSDYVSWLIQARERFGPLTGLMDRLQLFYVFDSLLFKGAGAFLIVNIVVCALNRWKGIWTSIAQNRVRMSDGFYRYAPIKLTTAQPPAEAVQGLRRVLKGSRYRLVAREEEGAFYLFSDKNRFALLGTYMSHLGLILLVVGYIAGSILSFRNDQFIITEGETRPVGFGTGLSVRLEQFVDEWWLSGPPKDYRSDVVIYEGGQEVKRGTIRVNHPLSYKGVRFFQSFYGNSAIMRVTDDDGTLLFEEAVPLAYQYQERSVGSFSISEKGLVAWVVLTQATGFYGAPDTLVKPGEVRIEVTKEGRNTLIGYSNLSQGEPQEVAGLTYTFVRERPFTGLQVARDPALSLIWVAFTLMTLGVVLVFYFPHRRLWSAVQATASGGAELSLRGVVGRDSDFKQEMDKIAARLRSALSEP